ncbi:hypothetical protein [Thalassovita taeanensis]|uniref:Uncharacterized protein n=1 Tax=Thalassovita taeanensis TaxID=657014 RepID=A0A1H8ZJG4_9RHOB|nr:hypothetical protein [Thalassovita taeanensis]SEP64423.1 hypothetical protein SAMN04488092_101468 [Thalassovita taeanensis]
MMKKTMTALGLVMALSTTAQAAQLPVVDVVVTSEIDGIENANAMQYWPEIEGDLESAIEKELTNMVEVNGFIVDVFIQEVRLNDSPVLTDDGRFNYIAGYIDVYEKNENVPHHTLPLILKAYEDDTPQDGVIYVSPDVEDFYGALLTTFAEKTATYLDELPETTPADETSK